MALYRLRALGVWPGEQWNFSVHATSSLSTADAAQAWATALEAAWTGGWDAYFAPGVVLNTASASLLDMTTGKQSARADVTVDLPGADTDGVMLPPQVALVVSLRSSLANRSGRGRFYLPAMTATAVTDGELASAAQTAIIASTLQFFGAMGSGGLTTVIYHRPGSPLAGTTTTATNFQIDSIFDTQRRRRDKLQGTIGGGTIG